MAKKTPSKPKTSIPFVKPSFEEGAKMVQSIIDRINKGHKLLGNNWICNEKVTASPNIQEGTVTFVSEKENLICVFTMGDGFRYTNSELDLTKDKHVLIIKIAVCALCYSLKKMSEHMGSFLLYEVIPQMVRTQERKERLCRLDREARELGYSLTKLGLPEGTCE
ncbi:MAG: hypothetical protein E6R03_03150 [Hyphomicrobiaceae bacterium]|nr:MAG: hypothetical protein E6R03_03150 [Hyphomicrobiaceae bacterium]